MYRKCGDFSSQASSSFPHSKLLAVQGFKAMGTPGCSEPLAFGDNGPECQPTGNRDEPKFVIIKNEIIA